MTQDEIIEMARQAGCFEKHQVLYFTQQDLEYFAKLVEEKATEEANARANASWTLMCKKMVAFEREACALICEKEQEEWGWDSDVIDAAIAIRARGEQA
jgi:hypothetical protein